MSFKDILKVFKLERELTDDETALLNTLRGMSESERELLAETLGPPVKAKSTKPATKRVIEKCSAELVSGFPCGRTRRAAIHKPDSTAVEAHGFFTQPQTTKSRRASSLAGAIKKKTTDKEPRCVVCFEVRDHAEHDVANGGHEFTASAKTGDMMVLEDGGSCTFEGCTRPADDNVHHLQTHSYYHEFQPAVVQAASGG